ncbi:zinc finger, PHD-type containing protein, partial [Tanacetum coccineum]
IWPVNCLNISSGDMACKLLQHERQSARPDELPTQYAAEYLLKELKRLQDLALITFQWPPRVTLGRLLPHARGLGFKPRRGGFPSGAKKEWGLSPKAKIANLRKSLFDQEYLDEQFVQLEELQDNSNPNFVEEVVTLFYRDSARFLYNIDQALEKGPMDFSKLDSLMHQFKSSSTSIGAKKVKTECTNFRSHCNARNAEGCKRTFQQVKKEYTTLKKKLETYFQMSRQAGMPPKIFRRPCAFSENSFEVLKFLENSVEVLKILKNKLESLKLQENQPSTRVETKRRRDRADFEQPTAKGHPTAAETPGRSRDTQPQPRHPTITNHSKSGLGLPSIVALVMVIDKSWTSLGKHEKAFYTGLKKFVDDCKSLVDSVGNIRCPCKSCRLVLWVSIKHLLDHISKYGFDPSYKTWIHHGEPDLPLSLPIIDNTRQPQMSDMTMCLNDISYIPLNNEKNEPTQGDIGRTSNDPTQAKRNEFEELYVSANEELYPDCDYVTRLDFMAKFTYFKVKGKLIDSIFNEMVEFFQNVFPIAKGYKLPSLYYAIKKTFKTIGLGLQRLYKFSHTTKEMTWHATGKCTEPGKMQHPVDGRAWKDFDTKYPDFTAEQRNVRLGLAADGFNPFGNLSQSYSMWPDNDVYLRPLIDDLKDLWAKPGVETTDIATGQKFNMRAIVLWTINDFPARSSLFGWSGQGYRACPACNEDTPFVKSLEFNGETKNGDIHREFSRDAIITQLARLPTRVKGKHMRFGGVKIKRNVLFELNWTKRSIFYELEYWSFLTLKHNLDVMHIEKNVLESILNTLIMNDKSKDTTKARQDLGRLGIRSGLWLGKNKNEKWSKPQAVYSFTPEDRKKFCQFIKGVKLQDGFGSNFKHKVTDDDTNITGQKSHDCHIMMQRLLPYGLQQYLPPDIVKPLIELYLFFKQICSQTLMMDDMLKAQSKVIDILCNLELIYPPAFFDIMIIDKLISGSYTATARTVSTIKRTSITRATKMVIRRHVEELNG